MFKFILTKELNWSFFLQMASARPDNPSTLPLLSIPKQSPLVRTYTYTGNSLVPGSVIASTQTIANGMF